MTAVDAPSLVKHVVSLGCLGVGSPVSGDIITDAAKEIGAVAGFFQSCAESGKISPVVGEFVAQEGKVRLLEGGGAKGGFGIEDAV